MPGGARGSPSGPTSARRAPCSRATGSPASPDNSATTTSSALRPAQHRPIWRGRTAWPGFATGITGSAASACWSGREPKFPFCLGWANESWTGVWHGSPNKILMEQTYPGREDEERHFHRVAEAFFDDRYLTIDGKPIFYVYKPQQLPDARRFVENWQNLALKAGLKGIYFIGEDVYIDASPWDPRSSGFDAVVPNTPGVGFLRLSKRLNAKRLFSLALRKLVKRPYIFEYQDFIASNFVEEPAGYDFFPSVLPNWDNSPRSGVNAKVLVNSTPELFRQELRRAIDQVAGREPDKRVVFIKSWNEWAEGNFLEPDQSYGSAYLEVCRDEFLG